jgi:hypothetical protein
MDFLSSATGTSTPPRRLQVSAALCFVFVSKLLLVRIVFIFFS